MTPSNPNIPGTVPATGSFEPQLPARADAPAAGDPLVSTAGLLQTIMDLGPRKRFGNYEVVRLIGQGAMGNVFEVLNLSFDPPRREALKVIRSRLRDIEEAVRRFKGEMARMASLQHPGIVAVFHADEEGGELFFTMPLEAGGDLEKFLKKRLDKEGPVQATRAAELVRNIAAAVEAAHKQNVVHRDLKPPNILLREDGSPVVTDFGLAVLMSSSAGLSSTGSGPEGTPCYMPPEQAEARISAIGTWSDVYALGAILYELLTLRPPFKGSSAADTLRLVVVAPLDRPTVHNAKIPPALEAICLKCLNKEPRQRYVTAGELAQALKEFLEPAPPKPMSWRRKVGIGLAVAALLVGLSVGGYAWRQAALQADADARQADAAARQADAAAFVDGGDRFRAEGHPHQAREQYAIALREYNLMIESSRPQFRSSDLRLGRARTQTRRGPLLLSERDSDDAKVALEAAQAELETLRSVLSDDPDCLTLLAETYHNLGQFHTSRNTPEAQRVGLEFYEKAIRLRHEVCDRHPGQPHYERDLARGYGYMGDTLLELDQPQRAKDAYDKAESIRARLANTPDADVEALCLHARDFGNRSYFHEWNGNLTAAIKAARQRVEYYRNGRFPDRLPGGYLTERADASLALAELELDRPDGPAADTKELLDAALVENQAFQAAAARDAPQTPLVATLAGIHLTLGKYYILTNEPELAPAALRDAEEFFKKLPRDKMSTTDQYRRAQAYALLAKLAARPDDKAFYGKATQRLLEGAIAAGFRHIRRVERDTAFVSLRETERDWYQKILAEMQKSRPTFRGN